MLAERLPKLPFRQEGYSQEFHLHLQSVFGEDYLQKADKALISFGISNPEKLPWNFPAIPHGNDAIYPIDCYVADTVDRVLLSYLPKGISGMPRPRSSRHEHPTQETSNETRPGVTEIYKLVSGTFEIEIDGQLHTVNKLGEVVIVNPGQIHQVWSSGEAALFAIYMTNAQYYPHNQQHVPAVRSSKRML